MPNYLPPDSCPGTPKLLNLPRGTRLSRIYNSSFAITEFNPTLSDLHWGGGRFDATSRDKYAYLYAGSDLHAAVAETLLRDIHWDTGGPALLPKQILSNRCFGWLELLDDLTLLDLRGGRALAQVGQDSWLTKCPSREYGFTRRWAHTLRSWTPEAQGFAWRSRRDEDRSCYVLFADRCPATSFDAIFDPLHPPPKHNRLDQEPGRARILSVLHQYNTSVAP